MSMFSYVQGLKPKTDDYEKRLQIYNLCTALNIPIPSEIESFFDGEVCEEIAEVSAYSEIQAIFLAPCAPEDVLYVECAVVKKHATL